MQPTSLERRKDGVMAVVVAIKTCSNLLSKVNNPKIPFTPNVGLIYSKIKGPCASTTVFRFLGIFVSFIDDQAGLPCIYPRNTKLSAFWIMCG